MTQRSGLTSRTVVGGGYRYMYDLCPVEADNNGMNMLRDIIIGRHISFILLHGNIVIVQCR